MLFAGKTGLSFKKALELAQGMEAAAKDVREMQEIPQLSAGRLSEDVHAVSKKLNLYVIDAVGVAIVQPTVHFKLPNAVIVGNMVISKECVTLPRGGGTANSRNNRQPSQTTQNSNPRPVRAAQHETVVQTEEYSLHNINSPAPTKPIMLKVVINNQTVSMELDTGSAVTLVSELTFKSKWPNTPLQVSIVKLRTYCNVSLQVLGQIESNIQYNKQVIELPLIVVEGSGPSLFGRDWLTHTA